MKRFEGKFFAFIFVLAFLYCGVLFAADAGPEKVYLLCKSETGTLKVISTTPDKVMYELEKLKNSTSGDYTVIVSDDKAEPGYYMVSIGDESSDANGDNAPLLGGNNPVKWFQRLPVLVCTEIATVVMLLTLGWYYKRRKLARQRIR